MFLSALALAAALQAAPEITLKGHLDGVRPSNRDAPVDELAVIPRRKGPALLDREPGRARFVAPSRRPFKLGPPRSPKRDFVFNPQMANCVSSGPERVANSEVLRAVPLSKLPKARGERAVARLVDGCPVAVVIAQAPVGR